MRHRIRDRKLVQWALAYAAASWLLLQVFDIVSGPLGWSRIAFVTLIVLLVAGLPCVLVLAWYHGEQGRQRVSGPELMMLATLFVIAGAGVSLATHTGNADQASGEDRMRLGGLSELDSLTVAVLPFENVSADASDAFFADGIHEETIARLSKIRALRVISRTSVLQYRDDPPAIPVIGNELGAGTILEGSVRRAGQRVRITAQLIDARSDRHLWAETYERELSAENVFAIQTEIASRVATELEATLSPEESQRVAERPTKSLQAYEFWLRGNASRNLGYDEPDVRRAIAMYEQAVELDPGFGLAFARLARAHDDMRWFGYDVSVVRDRAATDALDMALQLQPDHAETEVAAGYIAYHRLAYDSALVHFERARVLDPNSNEPVAAMAFLRRRQGRYEEALEYLDEAIQLDPHSSRQFFNTGETALLLRRCDDAERYFNRALSLTPTWARAHGYLIFTDLACFGDVERALEAVSAATEATTNVEDPYLIHATVLVELLARRYDRALQLVDGITTETVTEQFFFLPKSYLQGEVLTVMGDTVRGKAAFEQARIELEREAAENPSDDRVHGSLGLTYAYLGLAEQAVAEGSRGRELMPREKDAYKALYRDEDMARILGILGRRAEAAAMWKDLLDGPGITTRNLLRLDPRLDPMRGLPAFDSLYQ